jgi:hypothetical protein
MAALTLLIGATNARARQSNPGEGVPDTIHYYETVAMMSSAAAASNQAQSGAGTVDLSFETLGRHFDLKLEPHSPFAPGATVRWVDDSGAVVEPASGQFFRGRVDSDPNSWVRLTFRGDALAGVISTDDEMYFLEPAARFFGEEAAHETLAYRLSDTDTGMIPGSCGARAPSTLLRHRLAKARAAKHAMHELIGNAASTLAAAANGTLLQANVGIVADFSYFSKHGTESANDIAEIINNVDGIYQAQLGVTMQLLRTVVYSTPDPFSTSTDPNTLLNSFSGWRTNNVGDPSAPLYGTDLSHLMTGRDLDSTVIGIAYIDAVCDNTFGAGVDQDFSTALNMMTLLLSHEMGHNFGAYHDAQANPSCPCCAASPGTFIMNPVISGSLQNAFSDCSKSFINPAINTFSCLSSVAPPPPPNPPTLNPLTGPVVVGGPLTVTGSGFTAGSVFVFYLATANGVVVYGPLTPTSHTPTSLTLAQVDPHMPTANGFVSVTVVNTDQGYAQSNSESALLVGNASMNMPTITAINGVALSAADSSVPLANVDTVLTQGSTVTVTGTGFNNPLVALYTATGNLGPLSPVGGWTSTQFQIVIPTAAVTGPGALQVINSPYTGNVQSNTVSVPIGNRIHVTHVSQSGSTITVDGSGFSPLTQISFFNLQGTQVANLGVQVNASGSLTFVNSTRFTFQVPSGAVPGPSYIQALNPPFITPASSSGNDPGGAFTLTAP